MSLTDSRATLLLPSPGTPFVVYGIWDPAEPYFYDGPGEDGMLPFPENLCISIANIPGGPLRELALSGSLTRQLYQKNVSPEDLPACFTTHLAQVDGHGEWLFRYLGTPEQVFSVPDSLQYSPPGPQSPDTLSRGAERMLRESLGIPADQPLPKPEGPLPANERSEEPYRFDPTQHMDLSTAEEPPPIPPPAPPGPEPEPGAETSPVPPVPPSAPSRSVDLSQPFAH